MERKPQGYSRARKCCESQLEYSSRKFVSKLHIHAQNGKISQLLAEPEQLYDESFMKLIKAYSLLFKLGQCTKRSCFNMS